MANKQHKTISIAKRTFDCLLTRAHKNKINCHGVHVCVEGGGESKLFGELPNLILKLINKTFVL